MLRLHTQTQTLVHFIFIIIPAMSLDIYRKLMFLCHMLYCLIVFQSDVKWFDSLYLSVNMALGASVLIDPTSDAATTTVQLLGALTPTAVMRSVYEENPNEVWVKALYAIMFFQTHILEFLRFFLSSLHAENPASPLIYMLFLFHVGYALAALRRELMLL